jgi:hypothetical protein
MKPTVSTMKGRKPGGIGRGLGAPLRHLRGRGGGGETPSESESSGDDDVEEDEDKEEGEITLSCQSPPSP